MTNSLQVFNFKSNSIRTQQDGSGEPMFCLTDVCKSLEIKNQTDVKKRLNPKGLDFIYTLTKGGKQKLTYINEPNLYRTITNSNKPQALEFENWIYEEVLPTIRKTGSYSANNDLVEVSTHLRKKPSGKREITLSERARTELGGIVKAVVNKALDDKLGNLVTTDPFSAFSDCDAILSRTMLKPYEVVDYLNYVVGLMDKSAHSKDAEVFCRILKGTKNLIASYETILSHVRAYARTGNTGQILLFAENQDRGVRIN